MMELSPKQDHEVAKAAMDAADAQVAADQALIDASKQTIQSAQDQVSVTQSAIGFSQGPGKSGTRSHWLRPRSISRTRGSPLRLTGR